MKKLLTIFILCLTLGISVVTAGDFKLTDHPKDFKKGWNLITMDYLDPLLETGELRYAYIFDPVKQEYVGGDIFNNVNIGNEFEDVLEFLSDQTEKVNGGTYLGVSFFVYLGNDVTGIVGKNVDGGLQASTKKLNLFEGWNFVANLEEFMGKSFSDFQGSCNVEKAYAFDNAQGKWVNINFLISEDDFDGGYDEIGMGIIVKVSETCSFDFTSISNVPEVPQIPN